MKKTKIALFFVLWTIAGIIWTQIRSTRAEISGPIFQTQSLNLSWLIDTISQQITDAPISVNIEDSFKRFGEISTILEDQYYDKNLIDTGKMMQNAVKAYVDGLNDPYTVYLDAEQYSGFETSLKGEQDFEGIGAMITKKDYYVLVEEVIKDSPAFKAGIMPLDRIIAIEEETTKDMNINEAVSKIRGPKDTTVKLTIERGEGDEKEFIEKTVTRDTLSFPSVTSSIKTGSKGEKIGYITISIIGEETEKLLKKNITDLLAQKIEGIILDLRGNGGGFLPVAVEICSHFIPKGKLVVTAKYSSYEDEVYNSKGYGDLQNYPTIILVDEMTASAGEIIAMALQEQNGAKLVGKKTFGKGSIQTLEEFSDGASLKYTIGKRYSPTGKNINHTGVIPDIEVTFDTGLYTNQRIDSQLQKGIEIMQTMIQEKKK